MNPGRGGTLRSAAVLRRGFFIYTSLPTGLLPTLRRPVASPPRFYLAVHRGIGALVGCEDKPRAAMAACVPLQTALLESALLKSFRRCFVGLRRARGEGCVYEEPYVPVWSRHGSDRSDLRARMYAARKLTLVFLKRREA
ncbi:hypothetical protein MTO96_049150 [Rhipicephalus appendiculatus]